MFKVQQKACSTCISRKDSPLDLGRLENQIRDGYGGFTGHRICHHSKTDVCCRGFWDRHKDEFQMGQIAQRLDMVEFVEVDELKLGKRSVLVHEGGDLQEEYERRHIHPGDT